MQRPDSAEQRGQVRRALCTGLHPHGRKGTGHGLQGPGPGDTCMRQEQPSVWIRGGLCLAAGAQGWSRKALEDPVGGWGLLHIPLEVRPRVGEVRLGQPEPAGHWARPVERRRARSSWVTSWLT